MCVIFISILYINYTTMKYHIINYWNAIQQHNIKTNNFFHIIQAVIQNTKSIYIYNNLTKNYQI